MLCSNSGGKFHITSPVMLEDVLYVYRCVSRSIIQL